MRQFDVYQNPSERSRVYAPYIVVLQSHLLDAMPTVVVAPLLKDRPGYTQVSAKVTFGGGSYVVSTAELVAVNSKNLGPVVGDLLDHEDFIRRTLERLFSGF